MAIVRSDFAAECVEWSIYCGIEAHYVLGVAQLRSQIKDDSSGDMVGPFRLTQAIWDAYRSDDEFDFTYSAADIQSWRAQCLVFSVMSHRALDRFYTSNNRNPSALELYSGQFSAANDATLAQNFKAALDATANELQAAAKATGNVSSDVAVITNPSSPTPHQAPGQPNLQGLSPQQVTVANQIFTAFSSAPLGIWQAFAALANAFEESRLNPAAHAFVPPKEDSCGLFQLNRLGGLGAGRTTTELFDPATNIQITLTEALKYQTFVLADTTAKAIAAFVRNVEKPADISGAITARTARAHTFGG
jgi:hypothetical protein